MSIAQTALRMVRHVATIILIFLFVIGIVSVASRYTFNVSLVWSEEVSRYLIPWLTFLGGAVAAGSGLHLTIVDWDHAPRPWATVIVAIRDVVACVTLGYLAWFGLQFAIAMGGRSFVTLPNFSMGLVYLSLPVGLALTIVFGVLARLRLVSDDDRRDAHGIEPLAGGDRR